RDFVHAGVMSAGSVANPNERVIGHLVKLSDEAIRRHRACPRAAAHKGTVAVDAWEADDWVGRATTDLFRAKRAKTLAQLLQIRLRLRTAGFNEHRDIASILQSADVR